MTKKLIIIIGFLVLGLLIRVCGINRLPLYGDELTLVYDSYSLLKTGMDSTGTKLPITFKMGAGRPAGYVYFSIPFVAIFGPTEVGARALSVLSGLGIIVLMYFLGKKLFSEKVGLIAAFLTAISPWDIYLSRGGFEAHLALFFALAGVVFFLYADVKKWFYILWAVFWGLTIHTYPTFKLTLPLMFVLLLWKGGEFKKLIKEKFFLISVFILAIFTAISVQQTLFANSEARFLSQNIFSDQNLRQLIIQNVSHERTVSNLPETLKPIFINSPVEYAKKLLDNYAENLSPSFLYLRGDGNPVHNPSEFGMFYYVELVLFFLAIVSLWQKNRKNLIFLGVWILIVPLATMFFEEAHGLRNDLMIPPFILFSSYSLSIVSRRVSCIALGLVFLELIIILVRVCFVAPGKFASFWSKPAKDASLKAIANQNKNTPYVLSTKIDNIEYAYPVYAKINPMLVIAQYGKYPKKYGSVYIVDK